MSISFEKHEELLKPFDKLLPDRVVVTDASGKVSTGRVYAADLGVSGGGGSAADPPTITAVRMADEIFNVVGGNDPLTMDGGNAVVEGWGFVPRMQVTIDSIPISASWISGSRLAVRLPPKLPGEYDLGISATHTLPKAISYADDEVKNFQGEGGDDVDDVLGKDGKVYTVHTFNTGGQFLSKGTLGEVEILVAAGGGSGNITGGGGGGGVITKKLFLKPGAYDVAVGAGGDKSNGENSRFGELFIAYGGGLGSGNGTIGGRLGGSGGGAGGDQNVDAFVPGDGLEGQGFPGGASNGGHSSVLSAGGGGGGAGGPGVNALNDVDGTMQKPGAGGPGKLFHGTYYGGGGGGGASFNSSDGGVGGGGNGGPTAKAGQAHSGGGGGGGSRSGAPGGSGVVIVRYLKV